MLMNPNANSIRAICPLCGCCVCVLMRDLRSARINGLSLGCRCVGCALMMHSFVVVVGVAHIADRELIQMFVHKAMAVGWFN